MKNNIFLSSLILLFITINDDVFARDEVIVVRSLQELQQKIKKAVPGETILIDNGIYNCDTRITIDKQGTEAKPIIIAARATGGVEITGNEGFTFGSPASYVELRGFRFMHESGKTKIEVGANHCRISRCIFECKGKGAYLTVSGDDSQVDHNTFQNKSTEGQMISVQGPGTSGMARRTWIHHNYFYNFVPTANNCGSIQVGLSGRSMSSAHTLVEYNLFSQTRGENENICNKSCDNIYRFNTFGEGVSELSLRHGNRCLVYGNFFIGSEGIRFFGHNHKIYSNYFEGCSPAIHIGNGDGIIPPDKLVMHDRPDSVQVVFNTLFNNKINVIMAHRKDGLGARNITFANNIIVGGNQAVKIEGSISNPVWEGNIIWKTKEAGIIPVKGFIVADPRLMKQNDRSYHLMKESPLIGKSIGSYPFVDLDIDGQIRGLKPDIGADQCQEGIAPNHILTVSEVGPAAK